MNESLAEYFANHPEEEDEFIDEMARLEAEKGPVDYPYDYEWETAYANC